MVVGQRTGSGVNMYSIVHSLLEVVLERLLTAAGILTKGNLLAEGAEGHQAWQVLCRRFEQIRELQDGAGA